MTSSLYFFIYLDKMYELTKEAVVCEQYPSIIAVNEPNGFILTE